MVIDRLPDHFYDDVIALWQATDLTRPWNDPIDDLRRALHSPSSTVLAAVGEGPGPELGGTVMVGHDGHRGWVYYLAVQPRHQGRGLGRRLMAAAEDWLRGRVPKLQLMVRRENSTTTRFYEHLGYERSDVTVLSRWLD